MMLKNSPKTEPKNGADSASNSDHDSKAWARRILRRFDAGEKISKTALEMARRALGLPESP